THRTLEDHASFRRDLYYRLAGITVTLPPLRERGEDVLLLARRFLREYARQYGKKLEGFTPEAEALLRSHRWPGNVRELRAAIASAALTAENPLLGVAELGHVERA